MLHERFNEAKFIIDTLNENGYEGYFVGGAVRDFLLGLPIKDVDIATNAKPEQVMKLFPHSVPVGIEHGTVLVLGNNQSFEVTTYRIEDDYEDYRHPNYVEFVDDITLDLSRRDFTINAMAMDINGEIIDPFHGKDDLKLKQIKTVGSATERFLEDPLRMLRGLRFTSQLDFELKQNVKDAISQNHHLLEKISIERITEEFIKIFKGRAIKRALLNIEETKVYLSLPILKESDKYFATLLNKKIEPIDDPSLLFAFLHLIEPNVTIQQWAKSYKLSNAIKKGAIHLINQYHLYKQRGISNTLIYQIGREWLHLFAKLVSLVDETNINLNQLIKKYEILPIKERSQLVITGNDLIMWNENKKRGEWVGNILRKIEMMVVENEIRNDYTEIKKMVKQWMIQEKN